MQIEAGLFLPFQSVCLLVFLIALPRILNVLLSRSSDNWCPFLVLNLWGETLSFIIKYDVSSNFLVDALYQIIEVPFYCWCTENFIVNRDWIFFSNSFLHLLMPSHFSLVCWSGELHWAFNVESICFPRINPCWYVMLFISYCIWFANTLLRIFVSVRENDL